MQNKGPLTVFDVQLRVPVGGKWENVEFSFPPIPIKMIKPFPLPFPWN